MTYRMIAKGRVQGVGFRNFTKALAQSMHLKGSVENLTNGDVEIFLNADEKGLDEFLKALKQGNKRCVVEALLVENTQDIGFIDFIIKK